MYETSNGTERKLSVREMAFYLIISLAVNTFGNGLTVACNAGSAMWTASAANIAAASGWSISVILIVYGLAVVILNTVLLGHIEWPRIIGNLVFIVPFGYFVGLWADFFRHFGVTALPFGWRLVIDIAGLVLVAVAVSIYQRVNIILHPNDDMTNILRFKYLGGSAIKAQLANFAIPLVVILILWAVRGQVVAFNIGTLFAFLFQGAIIGWGDKHVFSHLTHRLGTIKQK
ncbi:hypothetical protein EQG49_00570 [Periweissella cryptocerci]|uniref:Sugar specific permease n=1 Tax=Periweissella cryptocerci TaxID=2506420 RepID=A0A4P6YR04_9LACO|nr:hypothetical protein [Periweissella cryptocerci]QBO35048.1 hypothetical protein EQG49_00570 [Periweissella cryptocerci]